MFEIAMEKIFGPSKEPSTVAASEKRKPERITGADAVVRSLEELGTELVFGLPGGAVLPLYDALFRAQKLRHVLVRHEQGRATQLRGTQSRPARLASASPPPGPGPRTW